jgi:hypothetical protein
MKIQIPIAYIMTDCFGVSKLMSRRAELPGMRRFEYQVSRFHNSGFLTHLCCGHPQDPRGTK